MKKIRCPKCDESITFDELLYEPGMTLVFECSSCSKQFKLKIPSLNNEDVEEEAVYGWLIVVENVFHLKQIIPLHLGKNVIGRWVKGTKANAFIKTVDPSIDTTHCVLEVKKKGESDVKYILKDGPSGTGTFLMNNLLGVNERIYIEDGAIITIGATTMIFTIQKPDA